MKSGVETRDPETRLGVPVWCHFHCSKMIIFKQDNPRKVVVGSSHDISVEISRLDEQYLVYWKIKHCLGWANGTTLYTSDELRSAFGLSEDSGDYGGRLIDRFGADVAEQGKFIRWRNFLNIPGPGTGDDGDPNISIDLDAEIKNAIEKLLG